MYDVACVTEGTIFDGKRCLVGVANWCGGEILGYLHAFPHARPGHAVTEYPIPVLLAVSYGPDENTPRRSDRPFHQVGVYPERPV